MQRATGQNSGGAYGSVRLRAQSPLREIKMKVKAWTQRSLLRLDTEFIRTNATNIVGERERAAWMVKTSRAPLRARAQFSQGRPTAFSARVTLARTGSREAPDSIRGTCAGWRFIPICRITNSWGRNPPRSSF